MRILTFKPSGYERWVGKQEVMVKSRLGGKELLNENPRAGSPFLPSSLPLIDVFRTKMGYKIKSKRIKKYFTTARKIMKLYKKYIK
jgi:hypothetical protein